jgi:hypothetical protein
VIEKFCASTTGSNVLGGFAAAGVTGSAASADSEAMIKTSRLPAIA